MKYEDCFSTIRLLVAPDLPPVRLSIIRNERRATFLARARHELIPLNWLSVKKCTVTCVPIVVAPAQKKAPETGHRGHTRSHSGGDTAHMTGHDRPSNPPHNACVQVLLMGRDLHVCTAAHRPAEIAGETKITTMRDVTTLCPRPRKRRGHFSSGHHHTRADRQSNGTHFVCRWRTSRHSRSVQLELSHTRRVLSGDLHAASLSTRQDGRSLRAWRPSGQDV